MTDLPLLALFALLAGFIDAVAGGGGLIQVPALFNALPAESAATVFGTNKGASIFGTGNAAWRFARRIQIPWDIALPAAASAFVFSFIGAATVAWLPKDVVRPLVLMLMIVVVVYTLLKPDFGQLQGKALAPERVRAWALAVGAALGFYDGFFGPGAGSFMIFAFVGIFGLDFLRASSAAKIVNLSTNAAALSYFVPAGHVLWLIALTMAVFNIAGAFVGARLALRHGSGFVRWVFLAVSTVLIGKFGYDTLFSLFQ
ncbi:MAG: TSUP family transporter [Gammaproteobacteria bacterium]|nr:TSUP family transporter [Gammaproteobacteria bacterium]MBU1415982.1 TSUP family transporter [Gammaproteobacteria bacterium]